MKSKNSSKKKIYKKSKKSQWICKLDSLQLKKNLWFRCLESPVKHFTVIAEYFSTFLEFHIPLQIQKISFGRWLSKLQIDLIRFKYHGPSLAEELKRQIDSELWVCEFENRDLLVQAS